MYVNVKKSVFEKSNYRDCSEKLIGFFNPLKICQFIIIIRIAMGCVPSENQIDSSVQPLKRTAKPLYRHPRLSTKFRVSEIK